MPKAKVITGILLVLAVLFAQVGTAFAAPAAQDTTSITGTVTGVVPQTDSNGVTTVLVTLDNTQTVRIRLEYAVTLGLVTVGTDANGNQVVTVVDLTTPLSVNIDPNLVVPDSEVAVHPIAAILANYFDTDPVAVNDLHEDGFGFGLIAQALWMEKNILENNLNLGIEAITAEMILQAKRDNDFSMFSLQDGDTTIMVSNWGQFRKALLDKKNNLGLIVSGHAENDETSASYQSNGHGRGRDKANHPGQGRGNNRNP